jgi:hypothetical protein
MARPAPEAVSAGLVEACESEQLFGVELTERQRELLASVEAGDLLHVWALGRRSGKTLLAALVALWTCLLRPELRVSLRRRERLYAVAVATNLRQARIFVEQARTIVEASPLLAPLVESVSEDELRFRNRSVLGAFPCTSRGGRGWPIAALLLDEAAHMLDTDGNQAAEPMFRSLAPSVAQFGDAARIIVASSPFGVDGFFAETFSSVAAGDLPGASAVQAGTLDVRPGFATAALDLECRRDPFGFRAEYGAEFLPAGSAFMDAARVREAVGRKRELRPGEVVDPVAAIDLAFVSDSTALVIVGRDRKDRDRLRLVLARSWTPSPGRPLSPAAVLDEIAGLCRAHGVASIYTDQFNAVSAREHLVGRGLYASIVTTTADSKSAMFSDLRERLYEGAVELYEQPDLLAEIGRLETVTTPGRATVRSPRAAGSHGDLVTALALACSKLCPVQGSGMRVYVASGLLPNRPPRRDAVRDHEQVALAARLGQVFGAPTSFARRRLRRAPGAGGATALDRQLGEAGIDRWSVETGQAQLQEIMDRAARGGR